MRVSSRKRAPRIIEASIRRENSRERAVRRHRRLRAQPRVSRILLIRDPIGCAQRRSAVTLNVPGKTQTRLKYFPVRVPDVRTGFGRVRYVIPLLESRIAREEQTRRGIYKHGTS